MKKIQFILTNLILILCLSLSVFAEGDFIIENGVLIKYSGSESTVSISENITSIAVNAFNENLSLSTIVISSRSCTFEAGAIPQNVIIKGYTGSEAERCAARDGIKFSPIIQKHTILIEYKYSDGTRAADDYKSELEEGESYTVNSSIISGYSCDKETVSGVMGTEDIKITVTYKEIIETGWHREGRSFRYYDGDKFLTGTAAVGGVSYSFDQSGYLLLDGDFFTADGSTYYLQGGQYVTGYQIIGSAIYCFSDSGEMVKSTSRDGYNFGEDGRMIGDNIMIMLGGKTYFLTGSELFSGMTMIGNYIYVFGDDGAMISNTTYGGITFDAEGHAVSGIPVESFAVSGLYGLEYNGEERVLYPTIQYNGLNLIENVHYRLTYSDNIEIGTATITIEGIAPFSGVKYAYYSILEPRKYLLMINYTDKRRNTVAEPYTAELEVGEEFSIKSPDIDGYTPDMEEITGTMGASDMTFKVIYTPDKSDTDTETADQTTAPETIEKSVVERSVKYNYGLLIRVFIVSTLIVGTAIILIINEDMIRKYIAKKKSKRPESKDKKNKKGKSSK